MQKQTTSHMYVTNTPQNYTAKKANIFNEKKLTLMSGRAQASQKIHETCNTHTHTYANATNMVVQCCSIYYNIAQEKTT